MPNPATPDRRALVQALADVRAIREAVRLRLLVAADELAAEAIARLKRLPGMEDA